MDVGHGCKARQAVRIGAVYKGIALCMHVDVKYMDETAPRGRELEKEYVSYCITWHGSIPSEFLKKSAGQPWHCVWFSFGKATACCPVESLRLAFGKLKTYTPVSQPRVLQAKCTKFKANPPAGQPHMQGHFGAVQLHGHFAYMVDVTCANKVLFGPGIKQTHKNKRHVTDDIWYLLSALNGEVISAAMLKDSQFGFPVRNTVLPFSPLCGIAM